jgi:hypothetical protein
MISAWKTPPGQARSGNRALQDGAEAVLKLRALIGNGDFDDYFAFHLRQEKRRNHDSRYRSPGSLTA